MSLQVRVPLHVPRRFNLHPCKSFFNNNLHFFRILKIWVCFQYYTSGGNTSVQDERFLENFQSSPKYKKEPGGFLYDEDLPTHATFLRNEDGEGPNQILGTDEDLRQLKVVAGHLCLKWGGNEIKTPTIVRRIIDFQFAQNKRRKKFGHERPWGILGLYEHLAAVRTDIEWAEIAACRRANGEP